MCKNCGSTDHYYDKYSQIICKNCGSIEQGDNDFIQRSNNDYSMYQFKTINKETDLYTHINVFKLDDEIVSKSIEILLKIFNVKNFKGKKRQMIINYFIFNVCCANNNFNNVHNVIERLPIKTYKLSQKIISKEIVSGILENVYREFDSHYYTFYYGNVLGFGVSECLRVHSLYSDVKDQIIYHNLSNIIISIFHKSYNVSVNDITKFISKASLQKIIKLLPPPLPHHKSSSMLSSRFS
jgi:hypothetical protein